MDHAFPLVNQQVRTRAQQADPADSGYANATGTTGTRGATERLEGRRSRVARHKEATGADDLVTLLQHATDPETGRDSTPVRYETRC